MHTQTHMTHVILLIEALVCPQLSSLSCMCRAARRSAVLHFISTAKRSCSTSPTLWKHTQLQHDANIHYKYTCITLLGTALYYSKHSDVQLKGIIFLCIYIYIYLNKIYQHTLAGHSKIHSL